MARVRLELKQETFERLTQAAVRERRPVDWHAEVLLERALGIRPDDGRPVANASDPIPTHIEKRAREAKRVAV